jgi:dolichol kinase
VASTFLHELARKALHVTSAVIPVAYAFWLPRRAVLLGLAALLAVALVVEVGRLRTPRGRAWFTRVVGALLREHERDRWSGATWMLASYLLATLLFPRPAAVAAMLAVALGDAAAAVVGRWAGARRAARRAVHQGARGSAQGSAPRAAVPRRKTLAGSAACAAATAAGALAVAGLTPTASAAAALAAALAEYPDVFVDDNVRVALAAGSAAWLVSSLAR